MYYASRPVERDDTEYVGWRSILKSILKPNLRSKATRQAFVDWWFDNMQGFLLFMTVMAMGILNLVLTVGSITELIAHQSFFGVECLVIALVLWIIFATTIVWGNKNRRF